MLSNRESTLWGTWEELETISYQIEPPHHIWVELAQNVWKDCIFHIRKKIIPVEQEMIEERVRQGLFEPAWGPCRNANCLVPKSNGKYRLIISAVTANQRTLEDARILPEVEEYSGAIAGLPISSLIDIHSGYNQKMMHKESWDYMAFQTAQGMQRPTRFIQVAINSVSSFVRVPQKTQNAHLGSIMEVFVHNVVVNGRKSRYGEEEVEGWAWVEKFVMNHLQNLDDVLAGVGRAGATMSGEKSLWWWNGVQIVVFVCGVAGRLLQVSKVNKVWNWRWLVLAMGAGNPPAFRVWTGKTVQFSCRPV